MQIYNPSSPELAAADTEAAEDSPLVSTPDIEHFLHIYDEALATCDAKLGLFSLPDAATFASKDASAVASRAAKLTRIQREVYVHIHLHDLPEGEISHRGSIDSVRVAIGLFSDVDARGPKRKKPPETLCPTVEDAVSVVEQFDALYKPLRTSLLIASGHGCYPAILFKEPFVIMTAKEKSLLEALGRRFHAALHEIASSHGWNGAVDYCDPAKVLRLPGCANWKDVRNPKPVRVVYEGPARFNLSELDELLPQLARTKSFTSPGGAEFIDPAKSKIVLNPASQLTPEWLAAISENHLSFVSTWNHQRENLSDQSCSGYDMALAGIAVQCGLTDQQIADLLVVHRREFRGSKDRRGRDFLNYLQRTIAKARAGKQSAESAESEWVDLQTQLCQAPNPPSQGSSKDSSLPHSTDTHANEVHPPVEFLLAKVRATGDLKLVYDHIDLLARVSDAALAVLYQSLREALGTKLNCNHFNKAVREARSRLNRTMVSDGAEDSRPTIRTDDRLLEEIAAEAVAAVEAANNPPVVFRRGGALVVIHPDEDGKPIIMRVTEPMMRGRLARAARFQKETKQGPLNVSPPQDLTLDVLSSHEGTFPALGVLTQLPILRADGSIRLEAGYDPATRAYYLPTPDFHLRSIPESPGPDELQTAVRLLDEAIGEFPFESQADKANCIGLMLSPILRIAFKIRSPLALIDAPKWGTGKTLLAMVVYVIATGSEGTVCAAPTIEEEWRKRMVSILERGSAVVIIDNVDQTLKSPSLSAVLTSAYWEDRVLGRSEDVRLPNVATWIATGNNLTLGGEMARRAYRIRLDARVANPARRAGFKRTDQDLLDWLAANRGEFVAALLTMIRAWWAAGRPNADVPAFGSFNKWAQIAGGILEHAGFGGFLDNLDSVQVEADEESIQWDQFLRALVATFGGEEFSVSEMVEVVVHGPSRLSFSFPDEIGHPDERIDGGQASLVRRIGKALGRKCGTRFGELELRIERGRPEKHTKVQRWRVVGNLDSILKASAPENCGVSE